MNKFGLVGYPLTHSFSRKFFTEKFSTEDINATYVNFEIDSIEKFPALAAANPDLIGMNVTIPYKEQVIPFLNELDDAAREIGAVNTIRVERPENGIYLKGFNTDVYGFSESLKPFLKPHHKKALILGTGGAAKGVIWALKQLNIESKVVSRTPKDKSQISYEQLSKSIMEEHTIIINTTPLGTFPKVEGCPGIPFEYISKKHLMYDLVYNPEVTAFIRRGKEQGATIKNGLEMLHLQALKAWEIWNR